MTTLAANSETLELDQAGESNVHRPAPLRQTKVLVFSLGGNVHCAGLGAVREIIPLKPVTPLPGAPRHVLGLINLRGTIVTVLDATMSEYGVPSSAPSASILLIERGTRVAGVVVDEVHDIGILNKDVRLEALLDLSALVQMALA
ncbi:MAG: chemotaxis protein CheW [Gemmatimonadaceae bacterium]